MKIQLKSDLHWENIINQTRTFSSPEREDEYIHPDAEVLVLAGDIINATERQIDYLLHRFRDAAVPILYVPGNHEYWGSDHREARALLKKKLYGSKITLLDKDSVVINSRAGEDVVFVGATLWTSLANSEKVFIAEKTRDFREITGITTNSWHYNHILDLHFIEQILDFSQYRDMKKVVVSHYLPSHNSVPEPYKGNPLNCIFVAEDAEAVIKVHEPDLWLHGHTHDSNDYKIGKTRVISNPKGRLRHTGVYENWHYNNAMIIEI